MDKKIKIGITGLGLIGASILKCLSTNPKYEIYAHSISSFKKAEEFSNKASDDITILKNSDIIFVCTKISKTLKTLDKLNSFLDKNTIVADVCSIKKELLNKKYNFNFILSHPMAGTEFSGFEAGEKDLFKGAKWLIEKNNPVLIEVINDLGAIPYKIDMNEHDYLTAQISHLPAILSFLLFNITLDKSKSIASSGFRDMTRLAQTNEELAYNMFKNNYENILKTFEELKKEFENLKKLSDSEKINLFKEIKTKRAEMYDDFGKNIFKI